MKEALVIVMLVISVVLLIFLFMQSGKVKNIGSSIVGSKNEQLFESNKKRGSERFLYWATVVLIFIFVLFSLLILVL